MATAIINGVRTKVPDAFLQMTSAEQDAYVDDVAADMSSRQIQPTQPPPEASQPQTSMAQIEAYGRYLEGQDIKRNMVDGNNGLQDFLLSAGMQTAKMGLGVKNLLGFGDDGSDQNSARRLEQLNTSLAEQSPVSNFTGRMAGGILSAAPLAAAVETAPFMTGAGMGLRALTSTGSGLVEGALEMPFQNESRMSNAEDGALAGLAAEPFSMALQAALKRVPFGALSDKIFGKNNQIDSSVRNQLKENGIDYDTLKPETKSILEGIRNADDVDAAIKNAVETEYGFNLTKGESSQDISQLSAEQGALRTSQDASDEMRDFKVQQNNDIVASGERIADSAGGTATNNEQVGQILKEALAGVKASDKQSYKKLYDQAKKLSVEDGVDIPLDKQFVSDAFNSAAKDHVGTHGPLLKDIGNYLARSGILDSPTFKSDMPFDIYDLDSQTLSVANSEDFIKFLNSKWSQSDNTGNYILRQIKDAVTKNADDVIAKNLQSADGKAAKTFLEIAQKARKSAGQFRDLWDAKDVLNDLTGKKANTNTDLKSSSDVVKRIMRKPEDARQVISKLMESGNEAAVSDLRTFVLKDMFEASINPNVPVGDIGKFSGAKLTSLIAKNDGVLKEILTPEQYTNLRGFEGMVGKATKMPEGVVNYSNTAYKVADMLWSGLARTPVLSPGAGLREIGAKSTVREAIKKTGREPLDYILKLDENHVKLNAVLRQVINQSIFEDSATLSSSESEYLD